MVKGSKLKNETHIMCQLEIEVSKRVGGKFFKLTDSRKKNRKLTLS